MKPLIRPKKIDPNCKTFFLIENSKTEYILFDIEFDYAIVKGSFNIVSFVISTLPQTSNVFWFYKNKTSKTLLAFKEAKMPVGLRQPLDQSSKNDSSVLPEKKKVDTNCSIFIVIEKSKMAYTIFDYDMDYAIDTGSWNKINNIITKVLPLNSKIIWFSVSQKNHRGLKWKMSISTDKKKISEIDMKKTIKNEATK